MDKVKFFCYAVGKESEGICKGIPDEVRGINCQLNSVDYNFFSQQIHLADLIIIFANLNNFSEINKVEFMVKTANKYKVLTVIISLYPIIIFPKSEERAMWLAQLDKIRMTSPLIVLDADFIKKNTDKQLPLIRKYSNRGIDIFSIQLILLIRALVDPMIKQFIGVDFDDYRLAFVNKGFYQTSFFNKETLFQSKINNESWLQATVIIVTIFLKIEGAINEFSRTSAVIRNMLEENEPLWLFTAVIEEKANNEPMITVLYQ